MNQMLVGVDWMSTIKPDDDGYVAAHIDWLRSATPDEWHRAALDFNWTNRLEPLLWIVMQDECELATALNIFWRCEPGWDLMLMARGENVDERDEIAIITTIAKRLHAGTYKRRKIAFDAEPSMRAEYAEMEKYCAAIADPPFRPHPDMLRTIRGHEVTNDRAFYVRYPQAFHGSVMIDLPPWDGTTPSMGCAARELQGALFNIGVVGVVAYYGRFADWQNILQVGGLALLLFVQLRGANASAAVVRSLMRENGSMPSRLGEILLASAAGGLGFGLSKLGLKSYFALASAGMFHDPAGYGKVGAMALSVAALWGTAWLASRILVRKFLFR